MKEQTEETIPIFYYIPQDVIDELNAKTESLLEEYYIESLGRDESWGYE